MHAHVGPKHYLLTLIALLALALLSFGLSYLDLGRWEMSTALAIAGVKALLVALVFMHLVEQRLTNHVVILAAALFVVLLVSLTALDVSTRTLPGVVPP